MNLPRDLSSWLTPIKVAFIGSLLLSFIAVQTGTTLNRDGMLYVDTARAFLSGGLSAAIATFNWPFLPILMAWLSELTGLGLETSGHLLNAVFLAGASSLLVDCARRSYSEAAWITCLVVLSLPGMNHYRNELLREYGCWFFFMLSFWLALRWAEAPRLAVLLASPLALLISALFRPEALALIPALALWLILSARKNHPSFFLLSLVGTVLMSGVLAAIFVFSDTSDLLNRIAGDLRRFNIQNFETKTQALAAALIPYAKDQAGRILFWGSLAIIPIKFIGQLGVFIVPLVHLFYTKPIRPILARWQPLSWAFLLQTLILSVFVIDLQFLAGRYVSVLQLLAAPVIGYGLWQFIARFPRWKTVIIGVSFIVMISNVVSLDQGKRNFIEAGKWLAENAQDSPRIYVESARSAYYAGWRFSARQTVKDRVGIPEALAQKSYDLIVLEAEQGDSDTTQWIASVGLQEIRRFGGEGQTVIIARPSGLGQDNASKTDRIFEKTDSSE